MFVSRKDVSEDLKQFIMGNYHIDIDKSIYNSNVLKNKYNLVLDNETYIIICTSGAFNSKIISVKFKKSIIPLWIRYQKIKKLRKNE